MTALSRSAARADGARSLALRILLRVEREGSFASILLDGLEGRLADRREAALLHEIVLGVLRHRASLDHALSGVSRRPLDELDPEVRAALRIGAYTLLHLDRIPAFAAVTTAVDAIAHPARRAFVNAVLREVSRRGRALLPPAPTRGDVPALATYHSFPASWLERWTARMGWDATVALAEACNRRASTVLHPAADREPIEHALVQHGLAAEPGRFLARALHVRSGSPRPLVERGLAWVQDEGAQLVPLLLGPGFGPRVADLCAAPGGKALQVASLLAPGGFVVALERHPARTRRLCENVARFAPGRVLVVRGDAEAPPLGARFDQVLLDAPCSATGTLRRHPEIKWRLGDEDSKLLPVRQARLLDRAAEVTERGGCIVYSVCSLEPEEGEDVVSRFLARHPDFRLGDPRLALPTSAHPLLVPPGYLVTSPVLGDVDGFFAARLERRA